MLAQSGAFVFHAEEPTLLQDRHDMIHEAFEAGGEYRRHDVEAIGGAVFVPVLQCIGHLFGRASERPVPATTTEPTDQLAHGQALAPCEVHDQRIAALRGFSEVVVRGDLARQLSVELEPLGSHA